MIVIKGSCDDPHHIHHVRIRALHDELKAGQNVNHNHAQCDTVRSAPTCQAHLSQNHHGVHGAHLHVLNLVYLQAVTPHYDALMRLPEAMDDALHSVHQVLLLLHSERQVSDRVYLQELLQAALKHIDVIPHGHRHRHGRHRGRHRDHDRDLGPSMT